MLLKKTLQANACFSLICGLLLLTIPSLVAGFLGSIPTWILMVLGVGLVIFAADVYWISCQLPSGIMRAQIIFWADVAWVVATPGVLWVFSTRFSSIGVMIILEIAAIVAVFALLEWKGLQRLQRAGA